MGYSWKILKAAVEQEILFLSEKVYEDYLAKLISKKEPFEVVDEQKNEDGTYTVVMRKRYNNNKFFQKEEEISDEKFKMFMKNQVEKMAVGYPYPTEYVSILMEKYNCDVNKVHEILCKSHDEVVKEIQA